MQNPPIIAPVTPDHFTHPPPTLLDISDTNSGSSSSINPDCMEEKEWL